MDTRNGNKRGLSQAKNPSGSAHPVKILVVSSKAVTSARTSGEYVVTIPTRGSKPVSFNYDADSVARRKANLVANRGRSRISTTTE